MTMTTTTTMSCCCCYLIFYKNWLFQFRWTYKRIHKLKTININIVDHLCTKYESKSTAAFRWWKSFCVFFFSFFCSFVLLLGDIDIDIDTQHNCILLFSLIEAKLKIVQFHIDVIVRIDFSCSTYIDRERTTYFHDSYRLILSIAIRVSFKLWTFSKRFNNISKKKNYFWQILCRILFHESISLDKIDCRTTRRTFQN